MKYFILNVAGVIICFLLVFFFEARRNIYDAYRSDLLKMLFNNINIMISEKYENEYKVNVEKISKLERIEYNDLVDFYLNIEKMTKQPEGLKSEKKN